MHNQQQGIALVMVLVFLTLLTLISTTAMQQNALQFSMIGNTQEQSQSFTSAENILKLAENQINQLRWSDARRANPSDASTITECKASGGNYNLIPPGTTINLGIAGATVAVTGWWCQNNPTDGQATSCKPSETCPTIPTSGFAPGNTTTNYPEIGCGTELYTIRVTFAQQNNSNAERVVESKYAVKCLKPGT